MAPASSVIKSNARSSPILRTHQTSAVSRAALILQVAQLYEILALQDDHILVAVHVFAAAPRAGQKLNNRQTSVQTKFW
jgi:hypothetical protein